MKITDILGGAWVCFFKFQGQDFVSYSTANQTNKHEFHTFLWLKCLNVFGPP